MHPSSNWKSPTFQSPHHSRPQHRIRPTRTSHASYVGHQHNIPYNLKGKPSSTCIQLQHDSSHFAANWYAINSQKQVQSQSAADAENRKCIPHEFHLNDKVLIRRDIGNPYLGKLAKPTQGTFKIIDVQQLPINGTVLIQRSLTSVERVNIRRLLPFFERYN
jgi:hypothetical protein